MTEICQTFQNRFEGRWTENPDLERLLGQDEHWKSCPDCAEFVESYRRLAQRMDLPNEAIMTPDWHQLRMDVWSEIDRRNERRSLPARLLRPVIVAPAAVVVIALIVLTFIRQPSEQPVTRGDERLLAEVDSSLTAEYPSDQELQEYIEMEFAGGVETYFIEQTSYSAIEEYFSAADEDWGQVLASLAEQQI